jgi:hypothetical protein
LVNFDKFDWAEIFGTVQAVSGMTRNQVRTLTAEIIEKSVAKHSSGQLQYVGDSATGYDFVDLDGVRWECKSKQNLFQTKSNTTKEIILKNYFGLSGEHIEQTFDKMILIDSVQNTVGIIPWTIAAMCGKIRNSTITMRVNLEDIEYVVKNVEPIKKPFFEPILNNFILETI